MKILNSPNRRRTLLGSLRCQSLSTSLLHRHHVTSCTSSSSPHINLKVLVAERRLEKALIPSRPYQLHMLYRRDTGANDVHPASFCSSTDDVPMHWSSSPAITSSRGEEPGRKDRPSVSIPFLQPLQLLSVVLFFHRYCFIPPIHHVSISTIRVRQCRPFASGQAIALRVLWQNRPQQIPQGCYDRAYLLMGPKELRSSRRAFEELGQCIQEMGRG